MFIAIIAALQSSIDSGINSTALMITRDIRGVFVRDATPESELRLGRWLTLAILLGGMVFAPYIGDLGGIYFMIQTLLSLFQGPMLALLLLGALTRHVTPAGGLITLLSGLAIAAILMLNDVNMLYVAFVTFCYSLVSLWITGYFTRRLDDDTLRNLVYGRG
jgi:SSS family solute:Na+ symporter